MKRMTMAKQNSLDDVGLDLDDGDDDFEDTPDSGNLEGFGKDSPRPGTPITVEGNAFFFKSYLKKKSILFFRDGSPPRYKLS